MQTLRTKTTRIPFLGDYLVTRLSFYPSTMLLTDPATPRFVVFYNGEDDLPDVSTQKLSDHFEKPIDNPELELTVTTLNINVNHNRNLLEACKTLNEYSLFVDKVKYYITEYKVKEVADKRTAIAKAVNTAIDDCIKEKILYDFLTKYRQEVQDMCTVEYYEQLHNDSTRKEGFDEGVTKIISNALSKGHSAEEISDSFASLYTDQP